MTRFCLALVFVYSCCLEAQVLNRLYSGQCRLSIEPTPNNYRKLWPNICFANQIEGYYLNKGVVETKKATLDDSTQASYVHLKSYLGLNFWHSISFHTQLEFNKQDSESGEISKRISTQNVNHLFLQLGNPMISRHQASVGFIDVPFGLNDEPLEVLLSSWKRSYWPKQQHGFILTQKNKNQTQYELSAIFSKGDTIEETFDRSQLKAINARASIDLAALEGTKLIASYLNDKNSLKQFGIAILNKNQGARTSIEWVRKQVNDSSIEYNQLFRINHLTKKTKFMQWLMQYEDDRKFQWIWSSQGKIFPSKENEVNFTLAHRKSRIENQPSSWIFSIGTKFSF